MKVQPGTDAAKWAQWSDNPSGLMRTAAARARQAAALKALGAVAKAPRVAAVQEEVSVGPLVKEQELDGLPTEDQEQVSARLLTGHQRQKSAGLPTGQPELGVGRTANKAPVEGVGRVAIWEAGKSDGNFGAGQ